MGNFTSHYLEYTNGSNGLYHSISAFESASINLATWAKVHQTAIELDANAELPGGKAISKMWKELMANASAVMDSSQELNARGKWDLYVVFVEVSLSDNAALQINGHPWRLISIYNISTRFYLGVQSILGPASTTSF
jgi:hypothetical protein